MKPYIYFLIFIGCSFLFSPSFATAAKDTRGKDFWLSFGMNISLPPTRADVRIVTTEACTVTFYYKSNNTTETISLNANQIYNKSLNPELVCAFYDGSLTSVHGTRNNSIRITSTENILLYAFNQRNYSAEAAAIFPVSSYGTNYYQISYTPNTNRYDGFLVVAAEDNTQVFVNNSSQPAYTLSQGGVYFYYSTVSLTGMPVRTSKPAAFYCATTATRIPLNTGGTDNLFEQLVSVDKWGKTFFVPVTATAQVETVRVMASEDNTRVTRRTSQGTSSPQYINKGNFIEFDARYIYNGVYIDADKPVAVCSYLVSYEHPNNNLNSPYGDPSMAWISPVEQMTQEAVPIAPYIPTGTTALIVHRFLVVTRTADKNQTQLRTLTGNWGPIPNAVWRDNPSGYSFTDVAFTSTMQYCEIRNPSGMLMWGYGYGEYETYYYQAGCLFNSINSVAELLINDFSVDEIDGQTLVACEDVRLEAQVTGSVGAGTYLRWFIDDAENTAQQNIRTWSVNLSPGQHKVEIRVNTATGYEESYSAAFFLLAESALFWNPAAADNNWKNADNWLTSTGAATISIPSACMDVYIPGNARNYPSLENPSTPSAGGNPVCKDIYFHFGGEVAKPHLLTYNKAFIRYNFGYYNGSTYMTDGDPSSATPMVRNRWYALAAPLKKIASGDFSLGGYPFTYQMGFVSSKNTSGDAGELEGTWVLNDATTGYEIGPQYNYAISVLVEPYEAGVLGKSDHANLNGLKGIFQMPYFEDAATSALHRIHEYNPTQKYSSFKYFYYEKDGFPFSDKAPDILYRGDEAYRFVFEDTNNNPINPFTMQVTGDEDIMVGNPFVSSLDFDAFYNDNQSVINSTYRLYVDKQFLTYDANLGTNPHFDKYIAPLQAFFIALRNSGSQTLSFRSENVSVVRPQGSNMQLRKAENPYQKDVLFLLTGNKEGTSIVTFALNKETGTSSEKLFIYHDENLVVPQLYILDEDGTKNEIQYAYGTDLCFPVGIKCRTASSMELEVVNVEQITAAGLVLYDKKLRKEINLYVDGKYSFEHDPGFEDRFELRISGLTSSSGTHPGYSPDSIRVSYKNQNLHVYSEKPMEKIAVYTIQGSKLMEQRIDSSLFFRHPLTTAPGVYLCEVVISGVPAQCRKFIITAF